MSRDGIPIVIKDLAIRGVSEGPAVELDQDAIYGHTQATVGGMRSRTANHIPEVRQEELHIIVRVLRERVIGHTALDIFLTVDGSFHMFDPGGFSPVRIAGSPDNGPLSGGDGPLVFVNIGR
jgi:hypothetical protein